MTFQDFWNRFQVEIKPGEPIRNWTAASGYLGDEFEVISVSRNSVVVKSPKAQNLQNVGRKDFEKTYNIWEAYCSGNVLRQELRDMTRYSKYTISMIKHIDGL